MRHITPAAAREVSHLKMSSSPTADSIINFLKNLKLPKNVDQFLESSKSDQLAVGGLAGSLVTIKTHVFQ